MPAWWAVAHDSVARGQAPVTSGGVVAQVWHGGIRRQDPLAWLLAGTDATAVDDVLERTRQPDLICAVSAGVLRQLPKPRRRHTEATAIIEG